MGHVVFHTIDVQTAVSSRADAFPLMRDLVWFVFFFFPKRGRKVFSVLHCSLQKKHTELKGHRWGKNEKLSGPDLKTVCSLPRRGDYGRWCFSAQSGRRTWGVEGVECTDKSLRPWIHWKKINTAIEPFKHKLKNLREHGNIGELDSVTRALPIVQSVCRWGRWVLHVIQSGEQGGCRPNLICGAGAGYWRENWISWWQETDNRLINDMRTWAVCSLWSQ